MTTVGNAVGSCHANSGHGEEFRDATDSCWQQALHFPLQAPATISHHVVLTHLSGARFSQHTVNEGVNVLIPNIDRNPVAVIRIDDRPSVTATTDNLFS